MTDRDAGYREGIEAAAKVADPWPGFPTSEPNICNAKLSEIDKAVIKVRQEIAASIRSMRP